MDLYRALIERRTVHRFVPGAVPDDALMRAVRAATCAPNHKLTWPWRFVWVGPEARERLVCLAIEIEAKGREMNDERQGMIRRKMTNGG